ncbi:tachykinin-like peptides receptor 86C isoform X2 [Zootermopsis nevadensis]|uniref:tachykinin-like peptides receptor 86C isoform X2 n=1 Tax=Zootermopsis nevadensis TaxID=136037 RepID=UPI000B8E5760|nr:tachykinin-like peptides receptor 86C isoform X2 [Zootermopsis nevadensis]
MHLEYHTKKTGFLRMQSFTNLLLANMCFAQLPLAVFFSPFRFVYSLNSDLYFGKSYCRFSNFVANMSVAVTAITLSIISVERFLAIVWSINTRMPKKITLLMIISFWVAGFAIGVPSAVNFSTIIHKDNGTTRTGYVLTWVDGDPSNSSLDHTYNVAMLHMAYVVPICIMAVCCSSIAIKLWFSRSSGQPTQREIDIMHYKKKEFIMLVSMMMVFATFTLPYHLLNIYTGYDPAKQNSAHAKHLNLTVNWLVGFPAVVNPMLNLWMNSRYSSLPKTKLTAVLKALVTTT